MNLSSRFDQALQYAVIVHAGQQRKKTPVPYIAHLLGVTSIALEFGGDEDEAIAALLHDAAEDAGGAGRLEDIRLRFGDNVATVVGDCTDTITTPKPPWRERKEAYIAHLPKATRSGRFVSACDKLYNVGTLLRHFREQADAVWSQFKGGKDGTLWYYRALVTAYMTLEQHPVLDELARVVTELEAVVRKQGSR